MSFLPDLCHGCQSRTNCDRYKSGKKIYPLFRTLYSRLSSRRSQAGNLSTKRMMLFFRGATMHRIVGGGEPGLFTRRVKVMNAYTLLERNHPTLPPNLRDFQVLFLRLIAVRIALEIWWLQADVIGAAVYVEERHHILSCFPTGMGKSLPMLITSQLLPRGNFFVIDHCYWTYSLCTTCSQQGSTTLIIAPLTTIKLQLEDDCQKYGFSVLVGDQVPQAGPFLSLHSHLGTSSWIKTSFFISLMKGGGVVISVYKNLCCQFGMFKKPFANMKFAWERIFDELMLQFGGKIGT